MLARGAHALITALVVVILPCDLVHAQTDEEIEQARETFREGVAATEDERWQDAITAFRAVLAVRATAPVKYNLAFALAHTEAIAEAADLLEQVIAEPELSAEIRDHAPELLAELEPRLGQVTIRLAGDEAGMTVLLDSREIGLEDVGRPLRVSPGSHEIVLRHGASVITTRSVSVEAGAAEVVTLSAAAIPEVTLDDEMSDGSGDDLVSQWWFWTIIGAGIAAVGAGIIIGVAVSSDGEVQPISGNLDPGILRVMP